ncbi:MAG TPA: hypothetical protein VFK39_15380 [Gemmatimonadaceae bacterium]|nr:hypothetical protein [Gemmatimonadaceae bacterium]
MSPATQAPCNHERRPGTTICLRCRHEERVARRRRALSTSLRVSAVVLALATMGAIASSGAEALQGRQLFAMRTAQPEAAPVAARSDDISHPAPANSSGAAVADSAPAIAAPLATAPSPTEPSVTTPIVAEGRTELGEGLFAVRDGRSVVVNFDVPQARTRRRDKFDRIVRATLPRVYGPAAQATLDEIPQGEIVKPGTLPADLEKSGLRIPLGDSASISLWPELRDARGGPLVVGYRAEVAR